MAGGNNPFLPPGANPGGPVSQPGMTPTMPVSPPGGGPPPAGGPQRGRPGQSPLETAGKNVQAQYKTGMQAQQVLDHLRIELDQLMDMGDVVRPEHVIEAAGRLVVHGIGATQLAQIMSDMPATGGEGLASWIRMHDVTVTRAEQQLAVENNLIRHRMGIVGLQMMAEQHVTDRLQMHAQNAAQMAGALSPSAPTLSGAMQPPSPVGPVSNSLTGGGDMGDGSQ